LPAYNVIEIRSSKRKLGVLYRIVNFCYSLL